MNNAANLCIDKTRITDNYHRYKALCGDSVTVSAVVKANAYGCGMVAVAQSLLAVGCDTFWVATLDEAICLRNTIPDTTVKIIVLEGINDPAPYIRNRLTGVVNHPSQLVHTAHVRCWIHIDTGMNRLGLHHASAPQHIRHHIDTHTDTHIVGYMTHLHSAEIPDEEIPEAEIPDEEILKGDHNSQQRHKFYTAIAGLPKKPISICNSDGVFLGVSYHGDMVRVGLGLYGLNTDCHGLQSAIRCTAPILNILHIPKGDTVGYNATYTAAAPTVIATVGIGHHDGIATPYSNRALLYYQNTPCPVVGRVSMDSLCIDISHIINPVLGDTVCLFDDAKTVRDITKKTGYPAHAILCTIGQRVKRVYTTDTTTTDTKTIGAAQHTAEA